MPFKCQPCNPKKDLRNGVDIECVKDKHTDVNGKKWYAITCVHKRVLVLTERNTVYYSEARSLCTGPAYICYHFDGIRP